MASPKDNAQTMYSSNIIILIVIRKSKLKNFQVLSSKLNNSTYNQSEKNLLYGYRSFNKMPFIRKDSLNDYKECVGIQYSYILIGPGSYAMPSTLSPKSIPGIPNTGSPCFSFSKTPKMKFYPPAVPGAGNYSPEKTVNTFYTGPSYRMGCSEKDDVYWNKKMYMRSPGPVYRYIHDQDIASPNNQKKVVSH